MMYSIFSVIFFISGFLLIALVLMRKGEGGGLSGAFGGMGSDTAFGVKAAKHLDRFIAGLACVFLFTAILLNLKPFRKKPERLVEAQTEVKAPAGAEPQAPSTPPTPEENK
ncbi:MAG: preprotein translocase subunit SecG [Planctomycetota bacterium]|jgi:preprotein translocase subunit SecG|nr:preprotein translocase subunit SecG [Planctomycetota bacterium]